MSLILTQLDESIGTITLNNERKRNCLSSALIAEMLMALDEFEQANAQVVIICAAKGMNVWSSGYDITELPEGDRDPLAYNTPLEDLLRHVQNFPAPVIAMIEGSVWGGACDLAFTCDLLIGTENSTFAMTPATLGIAYNTSGLTHFINVIGLHKVKEMFFTAQPIPAEEALRLGLLNHLVPRDELETFTYALAARICRNSALAIRVTKEQLRLLTKGHSFDAATFEQLHMLRRMVYQSADYQEGLRAFKEKRQPHFQDQ